MKTAKTVALILAGLLAVLAAVATWLIATFDANRYKSVAIDWMRDHKQRTLAIGDVKLSVFPRLQVELSQVALSEFKQPTQPFFTLASARLSVQLLPLLKQQLVIDQVEARGLSLRYLRNAQGQRNIDDLLQPDPAAAPASAPPASRCALMSAACCCRICSCRSTMPWRRCTARSRWPRSRPAGSAPR